MKYQNCQLEFVKSIPDTIWGSIPVTETELSIIRDPTFTRLLEIKQMGCAWIAFPGAVHTRFQHSLGVMHVADQLLGLYKIIVDKNEEQYLCEYKGINQNVRQCLRIAALLHDIGHPPFSHVIEEGLRKNPDVVSEESKKNLEFIREIFANNSYSHENATRYYLSQGSIFKNIPEYFGKFFFEELPFLAIGDAKSFPFTLLNPIINSDLDADKIDYLRRDGYYCGFVPTYQMSDFDGALTVKFNSKEREPFFYINKNALGTINSFLHTRFRLISEYQNNQMSRIGTQTLIDIIIKQLKSQQLDPQYSSTLLKRIHLDFRDSDIGTCFPKGSKNYRVFDQIRRSQIPYYEVKLDKLNSDDVLDFYDLYPKERLAIQILLNHPPSITKLQSRIRAIEEDKELLVDIRTAKPPSFKIPVQVRNEYFANVYYFSEIAKGIFRDSLLNMEIHFYKKKDENLSMDLAKFVEILESISNETLDFLFSEKKSIPSFVLLFLCIYSLLDHAQKKLLILDPWLYSQFDIQFLISKLCDELEFTNAYSNVQEAIMHPDCVRDFEVLLTFGLLEEKISCIDYPYPPKNSEDLSLKVNRINYRLTRYGQNLINEYFNSTHCLNKPLLKILKYITNAQNQYKDQLIEFHEYEEETTRLIIQGQEIPNSIKEKRQETRSKIRKLHNACLIS